MEDNLNKYGVFLWLLLWFVPVHLSGQIVKGKVTDTANEPIMAATLTLRGGEEHAVTDLEGSFELDLHGNQGKDTLSIACLGYQTQTIPIDASQLKEPLHIILEAYSFSLGEVTVLSKTSIAKEFSVKQIDKLSVYLSPFSNADPLKTITSLPYSTNTSESANVELRGSSGDFSRVYINDVPIYKPTRNTRIDGLGNFSILNTEMLENEYVYASNPPLKFGNSIAGLVEVKTLNSLEKEKLKFSATLASIGLFYSKPLNPRIFFQIYGNHQFPTAYKGVNSKHVDFLKDFKSTDVGINFHSDISETFRFNLHSYVLKEEFSSEYSMLNCLDEMYSDSKRTFTIVNFEFNCGIYNLKANGGLSLMDTRFKFASYDTNQKERQLYLSIDNKLTLASSLFFQFGLNDDYSKQRFRNTLPEDFQHISPGAPLYAYTYATSNHNIEGYAYLKAYFDPFILGAGLRKNIPLHGQNNHLSYQGNLKYNLNPHHSFLLAGGVYRGYSVPGTIIHDYNETKSKQLSLEYIFSKDNIGINLSIYKKQEVYPVFYTETGSTNETTTDINGVEISLDYKIDRFSVTASYAYLDSQFELEGKQYHSTNAMNYLVKGTVGYFNEKVVNVTAGFTFRPGLNYTPVIDRYFDEDIAGYKPVYGDMNSRKYNPYSSIDLSVNKLFSYKSSSLVFFVTLTNLLNRSNPQKVIYTKDYLTDGYWNYMKRILYFGVVIDL